MRHGQPCSMRQIMIQTKMPKSSDEWLNSVERSCLPPGKACRHKTATKKEKYWPEALRSTEHGYDTIRPTPILGHD